jgi:hypothetical protein
MHKRDHARNRLLSLLCPEPWEPLQGEALAQRAADMKFTASLMTLLIGPNVNDEQFFGRKDPWR